jgi:hypothetical protein
MDVHEAVAILRADMKHGTYSGGGYRYYEADPEALEVALTELEELGYR